MGKFLKSRWWVGVFDAFGSIAGGAFDLLNNQHSLEFDPNFSIKSNANADYRPLQTIVFTMQSERDKNSPTDCFITLKYNGLLSVCSLQSAFCTVQFWNGLVHPWYISQEMCA